MVNVTWDYTDRAAHYDKRADYSYDTIDEIIRLMGLKAGDLVADVGAGTGKLTKELLRNGLTVRAVEPNDAMREIGAKNTEGKDVVWSQGTGETTGLEKKKFKAVFFGSSFNVVDQALTLKEVARVLQSNGWFCCMWNHRDLEDPLQREMEQVIGKYISDYEYGSRRQDPTDVIKRSGLFNRIQSIEGTFTASMGRDEIITAWRSHATLQRQAGNKFDDIIEEISALLTQDSYLVPYTTRAWIAHLESH